jgi:hypothetical protein
MIEIALWIQIEMNLGFYLGIAFGHPTYNWTTIHLRVSEDDHEFA